MPTAPDRVVCWARHGRRTSFFTTTDSLVNRILRSGLDHHDELVVFSDAGRVDLTGDLRRLLGDHGDAGHGLHARPGFSAGRRRVVGEDAMASLAEQVIALVEDACA